MITTQHDSLQSLIFGYVHYYQPLKSSIMTFRTEESSYIEMITNIASFIPTNIFSHPLATPIPSDLNLGPSFPFFAFDICITLHSTNHQKERHPSRPDFPLIHKNNSFAEPLSKFKIIEFSSF